jgi:hypothetical protein
MAAEEDLITEYVDRAGFASDTKFVLEELNKIHSAFKELDKIKFTLDKSSGLNQITVQSKQASNQLDEVTKSQARLIDMTKKGGNAQREIDKVYVEGRLSKQAYNKELKTEIQLEQAAENSRNEAKAKIAQITQARDKLNLSTQEGIEKAAQFNKEIDKLNDFLTETASGLERRKINIGNYQGAAKTIVDAFERSRQKVEQVTQEFGKASPEAQAARKEFDALDKITRNPQFLNVAGKVGDTNRELRFFTQHLNQLEDAGLKNSQVYRDVQVRLAQLTDQIGDTRAEIKAMASDTRNFDLFAGSVNFAADALQTLTGAAVLAGASEEDAARATKTLFAVQTLANGVKGIANELTTKGTAANKAFAFVQGLVAVSLDKTAAAGKRATAALGLIGIAVTVVGAILIALSQLDKKLSETAQRQKEFNDIMEASKDAYVDASTEVSTLRNEIELAKQGLISKTDVVKHYNESIGKTTGQVKNLDQAEKELAKNAEAYIQFTLLKAAANIALAKAAEQAFEAAELSRKPGSTVEEVQAIGEGADAFGFDSEKQKSQFIKSRAKEKQNLISNANERQKSFEDIAKDFQKKAAEISNKYKFDFFGDGDGKDKGKKEETAKQLADKRLQAQFEIQKLLLQQQIDFNKEILENDKAGLVERLNALRLYLDAKEKLITSQANVEKRIGNKTKEELLLIEEQKGDGLLRLADESRNLQNKITEKAVVDGAKISQEEKEALKKLNNEVLSHFNARIEQQKAILKSFQDLKKQYAEEERQLYKSLYDELTQTAAAFLNSQDEKQKQNNLDQIAAIDARTAKEIESINQTVADKTRAADEIAIIEARSQAQKAELEEKNRQIEKRKASVERFAQIGAIAGNTAQGVVSLTIKAAEAKAQAALLLSNPLTSPYAPIALAQAALISSQIPLIVGIGAAQVARLALPRFADGKFDDYEGPAIWGDGGKRELKISRDGRTEISPTTSTLTYVKKDDIILPDADLALSFGMASMRRMHENIGSNMSIGESGQLSMDGVTHEIKAMRKDIVSAIKNKKENHFPAPKLSDIVTRTIDGNKEYYNRNGFTPW